MKNKKINIAIKIFLKKFINIKKSPKSWTKLKKKSLKNND